MNIIGPLLFIVAILGILYVVGIRKAPDETKKIVAWIGGVAAALGAWLGGLFDKLPIGGGG